MTRITHSSRRGFAMLLVLVSLAVATILATAYLASRDNSAMIGQNVAAGSSAKWAALATLKSGIATLQTETDWRTNHTNGVVFANATLAGASVDLKFMDRTTGAPPTNDTTDVEIIATARVSGIKEVVVAYATVPPKTKNPDLDLSEFVVFGRDSVKIKDTSLIARWQKSPATKLNKRMALGTSSTSAGAIEITDLAVAIDSTAFAVAGASSMVLANSGPGAVQLVKLPDTVVVPSPPASGYTAPLIGPSDFARNDGATFTITNDRYVRRLSLRRNAVLYIRGPVTVIAEDDVLLDDNAVINIKGDVKFIAKKNMMVLKNSRIELQDDATFTAYVGDSLTFDQSSVNEVGQASRDATGEASWMNPSRVSFYEFDNNNKETWKIDNGAIVKGSMYAPSNKIDIDNGSALYGRALGRDIDVHRASAIYYDHTLYSEEGYTNTDSSLYDSDGNLKSNVKTLTSLTKSTLDSVTAILKGSSSSSSSSSSGATPRPLEVKYRIVNFSSDVPAWEAKATMINDDDQGEDTDGVVEVAEAK